MGVYENDYLLRYCFYAQFQRPPRNALACESCVSAATATVTGPWLEGVDVYMLHFNCGFWYGFFLNTTSTSTSSFSCRLTLFFFLEKHINKLYDTRRQARASRSIAVKLCTPSPYLGTQVAVALAKASDNCNNVMTLQPEWEHFILAASQTSQ